jgi:hypothetical protein
VIFHVENAGRTLHGVPPRPQKTTERTTSCSCGQGDTNTGADAALVN